MKKIVRVLILAFCVCMLVIMKDSANAKIYTGDVKSALDARRATSTYMPGNQNPPSSLYRSGTQGCFGFVDLLCREIYGHNLASQKSAMELNASNNFTKIGNTLSQASGNLSANSLKELFQNCVVGDVVQMDYTTYSGGDSRHTMMVYSVSANGIVFYHAGSSNIYFGASTGKQPLWGTTGRELTWAQLLACLSSGDDGISVYRSTSVEAGTHTHNWQFRYFYAAHPHYNFYVCATCGAEMVDVNSSNYWSDCSICTQPGSSKISASGSSVYVDTKVNFSWTASSNTTKYNLKYFDSANNYVTIATISRTSYEYTFTKPGRYGVYVDSLNDSGQYTQSNVLYIEVKKPVVISFDANGGEGQIDPIIKAFDGPVSLWTYLPVRKGYKFIGWSRDKNAQAGQYWYGSLCDVNESITLYAIWEKSQTTIAYDVANKVFYQKCVLDGVNKNRDAAEVILYTPDYGATSMTNEWGSEVSVDSTGKVIDKVYGVGSASIPNGGFVISAHSSQDNVFVWNCINVGDYIYYDAEEQSIYVFTEQGKMTKFKHCKVNGHIEQKMPAKSPTTKTVGLTEGMKCANCGIVLKKQKTIAKIKSPKATTIKKCSASKKSITVKFKKCSDIAGYTIQLAAKKNMKKGVKTYNVRKDKDKYVIRKLKRKKKYYVRIRTFKVVNEETIYSKWSKKVVVKTK